MIIDGESIYGLLDISLCRSECCYLVYLAATASQGKYSEVSIGVVFDGDFLNLVVVLSNTSRTCFDLCGASGLGLDFWVGWGC